jgi:hypothetical protein
MPEPQSSTGLSPVISPEGTIEYWTLSKDGWVKITVPKVGDINFTGAIQMNGTYGISEKFNGEKQIITEMVVENGLITTLTIKDL